MSNLHPIFEDILNAFTGRPASVSGHIVAAAAEAAPDHGSPERNMVAAENLSAAGMDPADPILREPAASAIDAALRGDDNYEPEVEEEVDRRREWDRILKYGMVLLFAASAFGLLIPATPTPIDDSLPSGCTERSRATNPASATDGWRGFLWTT